jgi:methylenetetrahydrofolate dehydrogenase (NADP+) / methenyltetrahydrofolate cyclohydrolase
MALILDGKKVAEEVRRAVAEEARTLNDEKGITPGLAVILVGDNPASQIYVRGKENACAKAGFLSRAFRLSAAAAESELLAIIGDLNRDPMIHGILVQLPLPRHLRSDILIEAIDPAKDVDGLHPVNAGRLFTGNPYHTACTPSGVIELLDRYGIDMAGKDAVIVGRSNLVGKPLALLLLARNATVTMCHTKTGNLPAVTARADILVAAAGSAGIVTGAMVKEGAVVIDVGMNRRDDGSVVGDVAFSEVAPKASYITPVPGGVGPMTIAMLLRNTLNAARRTAG